MVDAEVKQMKGDVVQDVVVKNNLKNLVVRQGFLNYETSHCELVSSSGTISGITSLFFTIVKAFEWSIEPFLS